MLEFLIEARAYIYFVVTILLVIFLYSYIYYMYSAQQSGKKDYEKYARLALDDDILDTPIEPKQTNKDKGDK